MSILKSWIFPNYWWHSLYLMYLKQCFFFQLLATPPPPDDRLIIARALIFDKFHCYRLAAHHKMKEVAVEGCCAYPWQPGRQASLSLPTDGQAAGRRYGRKNGRMGWKWRQWEGDGDVGGDIWMCSVTEGKMEGGRWKVSVCTWKKT